MSLADELRKAKPSPTAILLDITAIVGSFMGAGSTIQAARMGSVELAMATATGRFFIYTGFTFDAAGGILLAADTAEKIEQIRDSQMPEEEKIKAIEKLLAMAVITGGLIASALTTSPPRKTRVATALGEERLSGLRPDQVYTLGALDDTVLAALKKVPAKELGPVAAALAQDPRAAARLSKAFGEKFITEVRANPKRSMKEIGDILGAEAEGVSANAIGGTAARTCTHATAPGDRDAANEVRTGRQGGQAGASRGATVDNIKVDVKTKSATLELSFGGDKVAVRVELKETADLSKGPHAATGGAGAGRIVDLKPPPHRGTSGPRGSSLMRRRSRTT